MRVAVPSDAEAIADLEAILFPNSMGERMVRQELHLGKGWVAINPALEGEPIIGYALVRYDDEIVDLTRLGVHPHRQRAGVGKRLLERVLREKRAIILTVQKDNLAAMKLYFDHGFEIVGHLQAAGAWVMRRAKV